MKIELNHLFFIKHAGKTYIKVKNNLFSIPDSSKNNNLNHMWRKATDWKLLSK